MENKKIINKILNDYSFLNISAKDLNKYIESEKNNCDNKSISIEKLIRKRLDDIIKERLNDINSSYEIINSYIINLDINKKNYNYMFQKIIKFMSKYNYTLEPDTAFKLIDTNNILKNILQNTLYLYYDKILNDECNNYNISILFEVYCTINNIGIATDTELEDDIQEQTNMDSLVVYLNEIGKYNVLSPKDEVDYFIKYNNGDIEAREILIKHNLKLVVSIVKNFNFKGMSMLDMIQEGNFGLITAIKKYDGSKKIKFSTYATWWIRQAITRSIAEKSRVVRLPVYIHEDILKFKKTFDSLARKNGEEPSVEEMAKKMKITIEYSAKLYNLQFENLSLNNYANEDKNVEFEEFIISPNSYIEEELIEKDKHDKIRDLLNKCSLNEREKYIIIFRFGLFGNDIKTLDEIGKRMGLTRESIRQKEANALRKIRLSKYVNELIVYAHNPEQTIRYIAEDRRKYTEALLLKRQYTKKY